jgi:hypothetical protein
MLLPSRLRHQNRAIFQLDKGIKFSSSAVSLLSIGCLLVFVGTENTLRIVNTPSMGARAASGWLQRVLGTLPHPFVVSSRGSINVNSKRVDSSEVWNGRAGRWAAGLVSRGPRQYMRCDAVPRRSLS